MNCNDLSYSLENLMIYPQRCTDFTTKGLLFLKGMHIKGKKRKQQVTAILVKLYIKRKLYAQSFVILKGLMRCIMLREFVAGDF